LEACTREQERLTRSGFRLPPYVVTDSSESITVCAQSVKLLRRCQPALLDTHVPVLTRGDGNCLFRAISRCLYGHEDAHSALRLLAALELGLHPATYSRDSSTRHDLLRHQLIVCPSFADAFQDVTTHGAHSCVVALIAVCSALGVECDSFYPAGLSDLSSPLTTTVRGRTDGADRSISLLWTTADDVATIGHVNINHFVPLFERQQFSCTAAAVNEVRDVDRTARIQ